MFSNQEGGGRPSIERGGTNTVSMEISGVGSRSASEGPTLLSQNTKESFIRRKQRYHQSDDDSDASEKKLQSATEPSGKNPSILLKTPEGAAAGSSSAPIESTYKRNRHKKNGEGFRNFKSQFEASVPSRDTSKSRLPSNQASKNALTITDIDSPHSSSGGGSPQEPDSALLESHIHSNPEQAIKTAQQSIASDDWSNKCQGMAMIMCVARHYPSCLQPQLHTTLLALQKEVKNLRSVVAKKAVECVTFLFVAMKRAMEPDLDYLVQTLLHKGGESNVFLREVVDKAIVEMIANVSPPKALAALIIGGLSHRNSQVRKMTSKFVCTVVEGYEPSRFLHSSKDLVDKALPAIVQLSKDSSPDARYYARRCLNVLWPEPDFYQVASRVLKNNLFSEAKEVVETLKMKGIGDPPSDSQSVKGLLIGSSSSTSSSGSSRHPPDYSLRTSSLSSPRYELTAAHQDASTRYPSSGSSSSSSEVVSRKSRKQTQHRHSHDVTSLPQEASLPEGLLERLQANNWSERYEAITELDRHVVGSNPQTMSPQLHKVFDVFCLRLTDRNSKVNLHALEAFSNMVPVMRSTLIPIINSIMGTLVPNLASRNLTIHSTAMKVLDLLSRHIDSVHLIPTVANSSQFGNSRVQPIMTEMLSNLAGSAYEKKPQLVNRLVLPVIWHHVTSKTPVTGEAKSTLQKLCKVLLDCMGQGFLDSAAHLSVEDRKRLDALLHPSSAGEGTYGVR